MLDSTCVAAIGLQWGDEGKGKIIDWLASDASHVARFQGGHNAGHTLVVKDRSLVLHLVPSGVLREDCRCYIGQGVALSLPALLQELEKLDEIGRDARSRLTVSPDCSLILPQHQALDAAREGANGKIGTTRRGVGPAYEDRVGRRAVRLRDVVAGSFRDRLEEAAARINCELVGLHGAAAVDPAGAADELSAAAERLDGCIGPVAAPLLAAAENNESILLEASQGTLLDVEQGSYPFVTSAGCTVAAAAPGLGADLAPEVIGIAKCYTTRVGAGSFPTELAEGETADFLTSAGEEFGSTTARQRRVGWLDIPALRHALALNGCRVIALTKLDILGGLETIRICTGYSNGGWAPDDATLAGLEPVYEELPGWGQIGDVRDEQDLPARCRSFLERIEELCGARIGIVSYGKERSQTLLRGS